jgi:hypothetical protein
VNGGSCIGLPSTQQLGSSWSSKLLGLTTSSGRQLLDSSRWSTGFGLIVPSGLGRFELNLVWVLSHQQHDRLRTGLQLAVV